MKPLPGKPLIAIVTDYFSTYQKQVVDALSVRLSVAGYGVLCVAGREISPDPGEPDSACAASNAIYGLLRESGVGGVIVLSGTVGHRTSQDRLIRFVHAFAHRFPVVSLGVDIPGVSSVLADNRTGMDNVMEHMTADPSRRRFVFLRGLPNNRDAEEREAVFRSALVAKGIAVHEELMLPGNFKSSDATLAMTQLLQRTRDIDAVVAANDNMAAAAVRVLTRHEISVPFDVIVSGFDDSQVATDSVPAITTVRQPVEEMARLAVEELLRQIGSQGDCDRATRVSTASSRLIPRASTQNYGGVKQQLLGSECTLCPTSAAFREELQLALALTSSHRDIDVAALTDALIETLMTSSAAFESHVTRLLSGPATLMSNLPWWQNLCYQLDTLLPRLRRSEQNPHALAIVDAALRRVRESVWADRLTDQSDGQAFEDVQGRLNLLLASSRTVDDVIEGLSIWLAPFDVTRAYMVLYNTPGIALSGGAQWVELQGPYGPGERHREIIDCKDLMPASVQERLCGETIVLTPIVAGDCQFGYLLLDPSLVSSLYLNGLVHSIGGALLNHQQVRELELHAMELGNTNHELAKAVNYDALTGLPNRTLFRESLVQAFDMSVIDEKQVALLFLDLDGFKLINDTLGHSSGDRLLQIVGRRLSRVVREADTVARLGGDEFTIVLGNISDPCESARIAQQLVDALARPYKLGHRTVNVSASVGIAHYPVDGVDTETLLGNADAAMYQAKTLGKNRFCFYTDDLNQNANAHLQIDQDLRQALADGDLHMHYQPRFDLETGELCAVESLMRWYLDGEENNPEAVTPDVFIRIAEHTGFITELDAFALDESCRQARHWQLQGMAVPVAVNVSMALLQQDGFVELLCETVERHNLDPALLELEVTESAAMTHVDQTISRLTRLSNMGVRLSIDDFGTGFSSLKHLKRLPVDNLKIDRSFLPEIDSSDGGHSGDAAIVRSVVALGKSMDYRLIAEGVETEAQQRFLLSLGCDQAQGYLFSRPLSAADATELLELHHAGNARRAQAG